MRCWQNPTSVATAKWYQIMAGDINYGHNFPCFNDPSVPRAAAGLTLLLSGHIWWYKLFPPLLPGSWIGLNYFYYPHPEPEISTNHGNPAINRSQMVIGERSPDFIAITISQLLKIWTPNSVYWYVSRLLSLITLVQSGNGILAGVLKTLLIMLLDNVRIVDVVAGRGPDSYLPPWF